MVFSKLGDVWFAGERVAILTQGAIGFDSTPDVSVVIPCYRSAKTIGAVVNQTQRVLSERGYSHEFILVNDGSGADTFEAICKVAESVSCVHGIDLARNVGQHMATLAGLRASSGKTVVVMDDDLQTHPTQVPLLVEAVLGGHDIAFASYGDVHEPLFRRLCSRLSAATSCMLTHRDKSLYVGSFYAMNRVVVDAVCQTTFPNVNIQATALKTTHDAVNVRVAHFDRAVGQSGYTFAKLVRVWSSLFNYSDFPVRACSACVTALLLLALVSLAVLLATSSALAVLATILFGCSSALAFCLLAISMHVTQIVPTWGSIPQYVIRDEVRSDDARRDDGNV